MYQLTPTQWDNLIEKSKQLQGSFLDELNTLESIEDPNSLDFKTQLNNVTAKAQMLVDLNSAIKLGLGIQLKPEHIQEDDDQTQINLDNMEE